MMNYPCKRQVCSTWNVYLHVTPACSNIAGRYSETRMLPVPKLCPIAYRFSVQEMIQYLQRFMNGCSVSLSPSHKVGQWAGRERGMTGSFSWARQQEQTQLSPSPTNSVAKTDACFMCQQMLTAKNTSHKGDKRGNVSDFKWDQCCQAAKCPPHWNTSSFTHVDHNHF